METRSRWVVRGGFLSCFARGSLFLFAILFLSGALNPARADTADDYVAQGRAYLETQDYENANTSFQSALSMDGAHPLANFYYSITRILVLAGSAELHDLLDRAGVGTEGRDLLNWTADFQRDADGNILLPSDSPTSGEILGFLSDTLLPQIEGALLNLSFLDSTFNHILSADEVMSTSSVEVDWGDIAFYKALLLWFKANILILDAYDMDVDLDSLMDQAMADVFSVNDSLLNAYGNLMMLETGHDMAGAKSSLNLAVQAYFESSQFIRDETDPQEDDFMAIDPEDLPDEEEFRALLADVQASLGGPVVIGDNELEDPMKWDLSEFFDDPVHIRNYLPQFDEDSDIVACTFPDPTFSGILPDETQDTWIDRLHLPVPVTGEVTCPAYVSGTSVFIEATFLADGSVWVKEIPLPGAYSVEVRSGHTVVVRALWDKDGSETPTPGDYVGEYPGGPFLVTSSGCAGPAGIDVELAGQIVGIQGYVTDLEGNPVEGATISLNSDQCWSGSYLGWANTDETGFYSVIDLSPVTPVYTQVYCSGYVNEWYDGADGSIHCSGAVPTTPSAGLTQIDFALDSGASIYGTVRDSDGVTLQGIQVHASGGPTWGSSYTDAQGNYAIWGLVEGDYKVWTSTYGTIYFEEYYDDKHDWGTADWVHVADHSGTGGIDFVLAKDSDQDGVSDDQETAFGTDPYDVDTDEDGIADYAEDTNRNGIVDYGETDPQNQDSDGDGVQDGTEAGVTNPIDDPDGAGPLEGTDPAEFVPDADPYVTTSPLDPDSDHDGVTDGQEDLNRNGRVDAGETDPLSSDIAFDATSSQITHAYMPLEPHQKRTYIGTGSYDTFGRYARAIGLAEVDGVLCQRVQVKGHGNNADPDADAEWHELWLAQDTRGVVWLLRSYNAQSDTTTTYGQAGAILWMPLDPVPGQLFRDRGGIYSELEESGIEVPALGTGLGPYPGSWKVLENPGPEEDVLYYAPGVGCVMEEWNRGGVANGWELAGDQVYPPGDHNEDCSVDGLDFLIFRDDWASTGCCEPSVFCPGDLNFDGTVDGLDFLIFRDHWSTVCE